MSAGLTAAGELYGGVAQYTAGQERSSLYRANAGIAEQQARSEAAAGSFNEEQVRLKGAAMEGQQVAAIGANNLQQAGTPSQVVASTAAINEMNALETRNNALRRSWGFRVQEASDINQQDLASKAGTFNALGTILGGGARAASQAQAAGTWF
jgi:hypothetical protein